MDFFFHDLMHPQVLLLIIFAYLLGSIPVGLILSKRFKNVDPRQISSGNIGATNVSRAAGYKIGAITLLLDVIKGALPILLAISFEFSLPVQAFSGFIAFLGHCFPVWLYFKGGKGVATAVGVVLILSPLLTAIGVLGFSLGYGIKKQVAAGSIVGALAIIGFDFFVMENRLAAWILVMMCLIVIFRHQSNIRKMF